MVTVADTARKHRRVMNSMPGGAPVSTASVGQQAATTIHHLVSTHC
jgi:hypothetical protein